MGITYVEEKPVRIAWQWTGSNEAEFDELLERVGASGSHSVTSNQLTVSWNASSWWNAGGNVLDPNDWLVEQVWYGGNLFGKYPTTNYSKTYRQVYP